MSKTIGSLPNGANYTLPSREGIAQLDVGIEAHATFTFNASGTVNIRLSSDNVSKTDIDGKICLLDAGDHVEIKNRLGADKKFKLEINNI